MEHWPGFFLLYALQDHSRKHIEPTHVVKEARRKNEKTWGYNFWLAAVSNIRLHSHNLAEKTNYQRSSKQVADSIVLYGRESVTLVVGFDSRSIS
ncbi:hypothetical protein YC2023_041873 [Brassica napus]